MLGINTVLVGFIFVGVIFPNLVKHKAQFYSGVALVLISIIFDAITWGYFFHVIVATLQVATILLFILAAGGLSAKDLAGEFASAYEVIRRGEDKPIIVPLSQKVPPAHPGDEGRVVYEATPEEIRKTQEQMPKPPPPPPAVPPGDVSIPLE